MITKEYILEKFPDAENLRISTFYDLPTCLFDCNYFDIEIRTIEDGYLINMHKFNTRDGTSEIVFSKESAVSFINWVFLTGL